DRVEQRRFACAVGTDENADRTRLDVERDPAQRAKSVVFDGDVLDGEQRRHSTSISTSGCTGGAAPGTRNPRSVANSPASPLGITVTTTTKSAPITNNHNEGNLLLMKSLPKRTSSVPNTAPARLSRPPTATQTSISIDGTTPNIAGEITPMCS